MRHTRPLTRWERRLQHVVAVVDRFCIECMTGEYAEWVLAAAILFCVAGALAFLGR